MSLDHKLSHLRHGVLVASHLFVSLTALLVPLRMGAALIRRQLIDTKSSFPRGAYNFDGNATNDRSGAIASRWWPGAVGRWRNITIKTLSAQFEVLGILEAL